MTAVRSKTIGRPPAAPAVSVTRRGAGAAAPRVATATRAAARPRQWSLTSSYSLLLGLVVVMTMIGMIMVLSASSVMAYRDYGTPWLFLKRQIVWAALGAAALLVGAKVSYQWWRKLAKAGMALSLIGLVVVLIPGVGITVNGSSRWLGYGQFRVQPSEAAKLALLIYSADILARRSKAIGDFRLTLGPVLLVFGLAAGLMMKQPDLGTTIVTAAVVFSVLFLSGVPMLPLTLTALCGTVATTYLAFSEKYRRDRMLSFLHPERDAKNSGYQVMQSLMGLSSGGIFGVGLGASKAKWGYLPHAHTDFIFAIIGEELGLVGAGIVVLLFVAFGLLGIRIAFSAKDRFGSLMAMGITAWVLVQAMVNVGAVIGILPVTGIPLPFVSFGGSSLVMTMGATGMMLNIAHQSKK